MKINPTVNIENVGGKGFQLYKLNKVCTVPDFFVICFDHSDEIDDAKVQADIINYYTEKGFRKVAVRSSATVEDSASASFAGMFDSELNVDQDTLISAIKKVVDSAKGRRVEEYCRLNDVDFSGIKMQVVVQRMIRSRVAGVCFTKESEAADTCLIEACYGLGEALVSGSTSPDTYRVQRNTLELLSQTIGFQKLMYDESTTEQPVSVPFHKRNAKKLTDYEIKEITETCLNIEKLLGYYSADIEWAYEEQKLFLLQVRPFVGI